MTMSAPMLPKFQASALSFVAPDLGTPTPPACGEARSPYAQLHSGQQTPTSGVLPRLLEKGLMEKLRAMQEQQEKQVAEDEVQIPRQERQVAEDEVQTPRQDCHCEKFYLLVSSALSQPLAGDPAGEKLGLFRQFSPVELSPPEACAFGLDADLPLGLQRRYTPMNLGDLRSLSSPSSAVKFSAPRKCMPDLDEDSLPQLQRQYTPMNLGNLGGNFGGLTSLVPAVVPGSAGLEVDSLPQLQRQYTPVNLGSLCSVSGLSLPKRA